LFRQDAIRAGINDAGLMQLFYDGLKEDVKDELYKEDRPATLDAYIARAIRIDDRLFARKQQKKGHGRLVVGTDNHQGSHANHGKKRQHKSTSYGTHAGPMDVDATQRAGPVRRDKSDITCYGCGKKGHFKRDCRSSKKNGWKPVQGRAETAAITKHTPVVEVSAASYTQDDFEDAVDRELAREDQHGWSEDESSGSSSGQGNAEEHDRGAERQDRDGPSDGTGSDPGADSVTRLEANAEQRIERQDETDGSSESENDNLPYSLTIDEQAELREFARQEAEEAVHRHLAAAVVEAELHRLAQQQEAWRGLTPQEADLAYLHEKSERLRKHNDELQSKVHTLTREVQGFQERLDDAGQEVAALRGELFQVNDALDRGTIGWAGPYDADVEDCGPTEIRNPEEEWMSQNTGTMTWHEYWQNQPYVSIGKSNAEMQKSDYSDKFRWASSDESRRLHPERADHVQVPWFQCVTHNCKYHFKEKYDYDHWPIRETMINGWPKALRWTYDQGQGASDFLWYFEYEEGRVIARPRHAWPRACGTTDASTPDHCLSVECLWHLQGKSIAYHQQRINQEYETGGQGDYPRSSKREARWARSSKQWLKEFGTIVEASQGADRDALTHQRSLGNGSGPSEGPDNL
jgi:hypothetical protein